MIIHIPKSVIYGQQVSKSSLTNLILSIGVMLYIMLCGYPPFYGENRDEIKRRVLKGKVKFDGKNINKINDDIYRSSMG
jgi:serine/threonine protein kinase